MMKLLFSLLLIMLAAIVHAQIPSFTFQQAIGLPMDHVSDVAIDGENNIYFSDCKGIAKLNQRGELITIVNQYSQLCNQFDNKFGVDGQGNIYALRKVANVDSLVKFNSLGKIVGRYKLSLDKSEVSLYDPLILNVDDKGSVYLVDRNFVFQKLSNTGELLYQRKLGSYEKYIVDGLVDKKGMFCALRSDQTILKLDLNGVVQDSLVLKGEFNNKCNVIEIDKNGDFYVGFFGYVHLSKFDQIGNQVGQINFSGLSNIASIAFDLQDNLVIAVPSSVMYSDRVIKANSEGQILAQWGHTQHYTDVAVDEQGNIYTVEEMISKYSPDGRKVSEIKNQGGERLCLDPMGNIYTLAVGASNEYFVHKYLSQGMYSGKCTMPEPSMSFGYSDIAVDAVGNIYLTDSFEGCVRKIDKRGNLIKKIGVNGKGKGEISFPNAVALDAANNIYVADYDGNRVQKFAQNGKLLQIFGSETIPDDYSQISNIEVGLSADKWGNVYVSANFGKPGLRIYGASGGELFYKKTGTDRVAVNASGTVLAAITTWSNLIDIYHNGSPGILKGSITGTVFRDTNDNCQQDADEHPMPGIAIVAGKYFAHSDENGRYTIAVDTGTYVVKEVVPEFEGRAIELFCRKEQTVTVTNANLAVQGPSFGNSVVDYPFLSVQIAANRRRRCFRNVTTVTYANYGYKASGPAFVTVQFPPQVAVISTSIPFERKGIDQYVFAVGVLEPGQTGRIAIQDSVVCGDETIRGLTVCTKAWITPANFNPGTPDNGPANLTVTGRVNGDKEARFVVKNVGKAATADSVALRAYANADLALNHKISLAAEDSLVLKFPVTTSVVRVEADQPVGSVGPRVVSATVEVSALRKAGEVSEAMLAFPPDQNSTEVKEDCQPIIDSFDPNDKLVVPTGISAQHFTRRNVPLRYRIRFQNTGSDVAYMVKVVDTLDVNLDISTLKIEAASHSYRYTLTGKNNPVLSFTFDDIQLPDSAHNPAASQGFIQFSIRPKKELADKTLIENDADIFFDYNSPVRTNRTQNRIYDLPIIVSAQQALVYSDVVATPVLESVTPLAGKAGTVITLTGDKFSPVAAQNLASINGTQATVVSSNGKTIKLRVPTGATTGKITLQTPDGHTQSHSSFTVYQMPTLSAITPAEAVPGTSVMIYGTNFSAIAAQDTVLFNGVRAPVEMATSNSLQVKVPSGATTGKVVVKTLGGVTKSGTDFQIWLAPTVARASVYKAKAGSTILLTGTNFSANPTRNLVSLGNVPATVKSATNTSLSVQVPALAQSGEIVVKTPGGQATAAQAFEFLPAPHPIGLQPLEGTVGTEVTLTGFNFGVDGQPDTVLLNQVMVPVLQANATSLILRIPRGSTTGTFVVAGAGGRQTAPRAFTVNKLADEDAVTLYPNPAHGTVKIDWSKADFMAQSVQVYSAVGNEVFSTQVNSPELGHTILNWANLKPGVYLVLIRSTNGQVMKRLLLQ